MLIAARERTFLAIIIHRRRLPHPHIRSSIAAAAILSLLLLLLLMVMMMHWRRRTTPSILRSTTRTIRRWCPPTMIVGHVAPRPPPLLLLLHLLLLISWLLRWHHPGGLDEFLAQQFLHTCAGLLLLLLLLLLGGSAADAHSHANAHATIPTTTIVNPRSLDGAKMGLELDGPHVPPAPQHGQLRLGELAASEGRAAAPRRGMGLVQRQHPAAEGQPSVVPSLALLSFLGRVHGRVLVAGADGRGASLVLLWVGVVGLLLLLLLRVVAIVVGGAAAKVAGIVVEATAAIPPTMRWFLSPLRLIRARLPPPIARACRWSLPAIIVVAGPTGLPPTPITSIPSTPRRGGGGSGGGSGGGGSGRLVAVPLQRPSFSFCRLF